MNSILKSALILIICVICVPLLSQTDTTNYDNDLLPASFHAGRREAFRQLMEPNFYYLTGYNEPDAVLVLFKEKTIVDSIDTKEIIYIRPRSAEQEVWTGK